MTEKLAVEVLGWKYDNPYDFYNNELTDDAMQEMLDGSYHAVINQNGELFGFVCYGKSAQVPKGIQLGAYTEEHIDIGLGMNPSLTGKGYGFEFFSFVLTFIQKNNPGIPNRLTVAKFNQRAIHLYEKLGFVKKDEFSTDFAEFMTMIKK